MKFAKEIERDLVPEWRIKYLDYKRGKKKLKAIRRALRTVNHTPRLRRRGNSIFTPSPFGTAPQYSFVNQGKPAARDDTLHKGPGDLRALAISNSQTSLKLKQHASRSPPARGVRSSLEEQPLAAGGDAEFPGMTRYGSIIGSPLSSGSHPNNPLSSAPPSLQLPSAALDPEGASRARAPDAPPVTVPEGKSIQIPAANENAFEVGETRSPHKKSYGTLPQRYKSSFTPKRVNSTPGTPSQATQFRPLVKRLFSMSQPNAPSTPGDVPLEAYRDLDIRQAEFFNFLDMELEKVEAFYKQKEEEATERLNVLREQLHIMRDRRLDELIHRQARKIKAKESNIGTVTEPLMNGQHSSSDNERPVLNGKDKILNPYFLNPLDSALQAVQSGRYGKTTKAMTDLATPSALFPQTHPDDLRDYARRPDVPDVPYQAAKRKLKVALQEYYRGLELLKSYALLNRTAFRKISKKYDKTVNAHPSMRYMTDKVNKAWFVQSDIIEGHLRAVEDLYARYFERGNHKVAVGKLRIKITRAGDYTKNSFRNGLTLAAGLVFGIQGLVYGCQLLSSPDVQLATNTSYLLQIYAGYFLMNFLFLLFCMACRVWHETKINYVFVFEYDTRHHLDWRQLCELPCFFIFLLGLFMWVNFSQFGSATMYYYYPVILIGLTAILVIMPIPILYHRSRKWLLYSIWRLFFAGLYPVEFRDFYLGDMFCSLTYSMGNIELFFCLYASRWGSPPICNSSHSRLLGFFSCLPGIWRGLQCIRRYYDTRNVFPHLVNCGKYTATILFYVALSIYRINKNEHNRALFITFATINAIYTSIWDVIMDWSLGDPHAKHKFLRQTLGYKKVWMYYVAMVADPILRFNWIFYAVIPLQLQHSAVTSFIVALSEVCRRGMWTLFRVENEHCTNVGRFRASRDVPLPYEISSPEIKAKENEERGRTQPSQVVDHELQGQEHGQGQIPALRGPRVRRPSTAPSSDHLTPQHAATFAATDSENQLGTRPSPLHRAATGGGISEQPSPFVRGLGRMRSIIQDAHAQDFERRKKPELGQSPSGNFHPNEHEEESSDDDDDDGGEESGGHTMGRDREEEESIRRTRQEVAIGRGETSGNERGDVEMGPHGEIMPQV